MAESFQQFIDETLPNTPETKKLKAVVLVMTFVVTQNLSYTGVGDLLTFINTLFGSDDVLFQSKYLFRRLWAPQTKNIVRHHYYCKVCGALLVEALPKSRNLPCRTCDLRTSMEEQHKQGRFFSIMNTEEQISFSSCNIKEACTTH